MRAGEGTTRDVATLHAGDDMMGLPEEVETVDEVEEKKGGKKRRTRQDPMVDEMETRLFNDYNMTPRHFIILEQEVMARHGESTLGVKQSLEAVLRYCRQNYETLRTATRPGERPQVHDREESFIGHVNGEKWHECMPAGAHMTTTPMRLVEGNCKSLAVSDGYAQCYRAASSDQERADRILHDKYAALLPTIKCTMEKSDKHVCVLALFTKVFDHKERTTNKALGSVKGSRCGKSAVYSTFLKKCLLLGILEDLSRQ